MRESAVTERVAIVLRQIGCQIVREQCVSRSVLGTRNVVTLVPIYLVRTGKQTRVRRDVSTFVEIQFERFETVQLSVQIDCNLAE